MTPTVRHGIDPTAGVEYLVTGWDDDDWCISHRPIGADGWTAWSAPVELTEVQDVRMPEAQQGVRS